MTCWHNDTYLVMRLFGVLSLYYFFKIYDCFEDRINKRDIFLYSLFLFLSVWAKPSFYIGFVPALAFLGIYNVLKFKKKKDILKRILIVAIVTAMPALILLMQANNIYNVSAADENHNIIIFAPFLVLKYFNENFCAAYLVYMLFPLVSLYMAVKYKDKILKQYIVVVLFWIFEQVYYIAFAESGSRMYHGNFGWGSIMANSVLYLCSFIIWYKQYAKEKIGGGWHPEATTEKLYVYYGTFMLVWVVLTGILYIKNIFETGSYI